MSANDENFRRLTPAEQAILGKLLELSFPGRDELASQLVDLNAKPTDAQGSLRLQVTKGRVAHLNKGVAVEARYPDLGKEGEVGAHVNVLLHVANGKLSMLEIFKDDGSAILKAPDPAEFQLFSKHEK